MFNDIISVVANAFGLPTFFMNILAYVTAVVLACAIFRWGTRQ